MQPRFVKYARLPVLPLSRASDVVLGYLVCASQRSGSQLLCTSLEDTGVAGRPPGALFDLGIETYDSIQSFHDAVQRSVVDATTPNGVCGQRIFWNGLHAFLDNARAQDPGAVGDRELISELICPNIRYVWLRREDKLRQAISFWRATAGPEQWRRPTDPAEPVNTPAFDRAAVERFVKLLTNQDVYWRKWFDSNAIEPIVVTYDELLDDRLNAIRRILISLDLEPTAAADLGPPLVERQADEHTDRYVKLYTDLPCT